MEAAQVELFSVLAARELLILRMPEGQKGTISAFIVRLLCENSFAFWPQRTHHKPSTPTCVFRVRRHFARSNDPLSKELTPRRWFQLDRVRARVIVVLHLIHTASHPIPPVFCSFRTCDGVVAPKVKPPRTRLSDRSIGIDARYTRIHRDTT